MVRSCKLNRIVHPVPRGPGLSFVLPPSRQFHADVGGFGVAVEGVAAAFSAYAGEFRAAEGGAEVAEEPGVDPAQADVEGRAGPVCTTDVAGPDGRRETVVAVVGECVRLLVGVEGGDRADRPEDLLAVGPRVRAQTSDHGRLHVATTVPRVAEGRYVASRQHLTAFGPGEVVVRENLVAVLFGDERHVHRALVRRPAVRQLASPLSQPR